MAKWLVAVCFRSGSTAILNISKPSALCFFRLTKKMLRLLFSSPPSKDHRFSLFRKKNHRSKTFFRSWLCCPLHCPSTFLPARIPTHQTCGAHELQERHRRKKQFQRDCGHSLRRHRLLRWLRLQPIREDRHSADFTLQGRLWRSWTQIEEASGGLGTSQVHAIQPPRLRLHWESGQILEYRHQSHRPSFWIQEFQLLWCACDRRKEYSQGVPANGRRSTYPLFGIERHRWTWALLAEKSPELPAQQIWGREGRSWGISGCHYHQTISHVWAWR